MATKSSYYENGACDSNETVLRREFINDYIKQKNIELSNSS